MGERTAIAWCHHTFNPWIGCTKVSEGCKNCYASVETYVRVQRGQGRELWGDAGERHVTSTSNWAQVRKWDRAAAAAGERRRVFCASMGDVFEDRADLVEPRARLWRLIAETPNLDWLLLTKRPENLRRMVPWCAIAGEAPWVNVWLGTTAENQPRAGERIPELLATPAAVRFVSYEPALGPVDFGPFLHRAPGVVRCPRCLFFSNRAGEPCPNDGETLVADFGLDWIIVGGESGPAARPFNIAWARAGTAPPSRAEVPVFVKQLGTVPFFGAPGVLVSPGRLKDRKGGDMAEWPEDLRVQEFPRGL